MPFVRDEDAPPGGVTVVAALAILVGIVEMCAGVVLIILSGSIHGYSTASAIAFGIVTVLVGAIYAWVGSGLLKLDPSAWMVGVFISGFRAIYDLVWLLVLGIDGIGIASLVALILNLMVFIVLWSSRSSFGAGAGGGPGPVQPA
ncbi:MAG TPA: hypothetical protein VGO48_14025 [Conexibacter sp.]|jgi:hypothetical protein|nr:hypothetical protein [Conexibacter sp.]